MEITKYVREMRRKNIQGIMMALQSPLSETFRTHARDAAAAADILERETLFGQASGSVQGMMKRGAAATTDTHNKAAEKSAKDAKQSTDDILFIEMLNGLRDQIDGKQREIDQFDKDIDKLRSAIEFLNGGNNFELNADGSLKDVELEEIIARFEDTYGTKIDRNNPEQLGFIIDDIDINKREIAADRDRLINEHNNMLEENPDRARDLGIFAKMLSTEVEQESFELSVNKVEDHSVRAHLTRSRDDLSDVEKEYAVGGVTDNGAGMFFGGKSLAADFGLAASGANIDSIDVNTAPTLSETFPAPSL